MAYFLDNYSIHEDSKNIILTEEQERYCRVVYRLLESGDATFDSLWNPDLKYSNEFVILPLRSTGANPESLSANTEFANVVGSTHDNCPDGSNRWLSYWISKTNHRGFVSICYTDGCFYDPYGHPYQTIIYPRRGDNGFRTDVTENASCDLTTIVGAHVLLGKAPEPSAEGAPIYVLPICDKHNVAHTLSHRWGTGFYMKLRNPTTALKLVGYLKDIKQYIDEAGDSIRIE